MASSLDGYDTVYNLISVASKADSSFGVVHGLPIKG